MNKFVPRGLLLFLSLCRFIAPSYAAQSSIAGYWEGVGKLPGDEFQIAVTFRTEAHAIKASIDIPDSGIFRWSLADVSTNDAKVHFVFPTDLGSIPFDGELSGDTITGTFQFGALSAPFILKRSAVKPLPYREEEVRFRNGNVTLAGTLLLPNTNAPHPAIVFHHGAYADTRNAWRFYADHLARMGIATLVYDNRGAGKTNGNPHVSFEDLAGDALACVAHLKADPRIRGTEIGLFSGSQGGWVASVAAVRSSDVAFVVMIAGPGEPVWRNVLHESESMLRAAKFTAGDIAKALAAKQRIEARIASGASDDEIDRSLAEIQGERWAEYIGIPQRGTWQRTWWRQIGAFDPSANWSRVHIPVLVLDGTLDTQVPVADSHAAFAQAFGKAGNPDFSFLVFNGAGHGLELETRPVLAAGVVPALSAWVRNHVTLTPASGP